MTQKEMIREIASELSFFPEIEQKENFLFALGALEARIISLQKAAEIMQMDKDVFLKILDLMGIEFSYLETPDIALERTWE
jgi:predicted HTH domain antitoxin